MIDDRVSELLREVGLHVDPAIDVTIQGRDPVLASPFPVGEAAAVAIGACSAAAAELWRRRTGAGLAVELAVRDAAASLVSFLLLQRDGTTPLADDRTRVITQLYEAGDDRWVHLHGGFPHLAEGTLELLGCRPERGAIAAAVRGGAAADLEEAIAAAGLCGAMVRSRDEWMAQPQAAAIAPLGRVAVTKIAEGDPIPAGDGQRPLGGVRALDLTRLLAGPTAGRTLTEHGADVLVISSPTVANVPLFLIDTGHGKRSAFLELDDPADARRLAELAADADVFVQNYRAGSLARRGFGPDELAAGHRGLIYVSVNCYGDVGPWRERGGWEQMAESVTGICAGQRADGRPELVPAAPCDYLTGYLAALGTMAALARRAEEGGSYLVQASLCQTGQWLSGLGATCDPDAASGLAGISELLVTTPTAEGDLRHLPPTATMTATPPRWDRPPPAFGADQPSWP